MPGTEESKAVLERDVYRNVLRILGAMDPIDPLKEVLSNLVRLSTAQRGYLELYDDESPGKPRWAISDGCSEDQEAQIRAVTAKGIVAEAIASGTTVHTPFALLDPRFSGSGSVREQHLEAVLCVPLKGRHPGVLYLEGQRGRGPFANETIATVETVASFIATAAERALSKAGGTDDPTFPFRQRLHLEGILGRSEALAHVFNQVALAAPLEVTVLLTGTCGTGKTQLANAIHANGPRSNGPFVELNCAALPEGLIESELFGTRKGAFTGARDASGKVEAANGGTLFLDEISEIPIGSQAKLLQFLQSKQFYPLASTRPSTANIRLIAATNQDLEALVAEKRFREDLYYRINVFRIRMPSLSERRGDIPCLIEELASRIADEHQLPRLRPSPSFLAACETSEWPGNVRELRNRVEQALIRACAEGASALEARYLSDDPEKGSERPLSFQEATRIFQRDLLRRELENTGWNVAEVARRLELARSHVYNLIKAFALARSPGSGE